MSKLLGMQLAPFQTGVAVAIGSFIVAGGAFAAYRFLSAANALSFNTPLSKKEHDEGSLPSSPVVLLVDNGSLRAASVFSLRDLAAKVEARTGMRVVAASARISDRIPPKEFGDGNTLPPDIVATAVKRLFTVSPHFIILPAFLGPSETLSQYIPEVFETLRKQKKQKHGDGESRSTSFNNHTTEEKQEEEEEIELRYVMAKPLVVLDESHGAAATAGLTIKKNDDTRIAQIVVERVKEQILAYMVASFSSSSTATASTTNKRGKRKLPSIAVCDHGSPSKEVAEVRNHVALQVQHLLEQDPDLQQILHQGQQGEEEKEEEEEEEEEEKNSTLSRRRSNSRRKLSWNVSPCSMERRQGEMYDFNEPLLENLLRDPNKGFHEGHVIVALLFISPGKHAGEGGDIATIIQAAEAEAQARIVMKTNINNRDEEDNTPVLKAVMTPLLGSHPMLIDILVDRLREVL